MTAIKGKVWKFGDAIDTDIIIPARYLIQPLDEMKWKAMEPVRPDFARLVKSGDVIVGGLNFGCGSSREQAPAVLYSLGIRAIVAASFARIFFRNAINIGLPVIECPQVCDEAEEGDVMQIEPFSGRVFLPDKDMEFTGSKLPRFLLDIIETGGLIAHEKTREKIR